MVTKRDLEVLERLLQGGQFDIAVKIYRGVMDCDRETAEDFLRKIRTEVKVRPPAKNGRKD